MRYLVTYWSQTGNTRKVAEAIFEVLPAEKSLKPFDEVETLDGYDFIFTGFPIMQFGPPPAAKIFLSTHAAGKNIAMFVTHAIPGANPQQQVMLGKELGRCRSAFAKSEILGLFHCQGELSEKAANELISTNIPMLMEFAAMRPLTIGHPNPAELEQARVFANAVIKI